MKRSANILWSKAGYRRVMVDGEVTLTDKNCSGADPGRLLRHVMALIEGRDHVIPEDVQRIAVPVLAHRLVLETKARYAGTDKSEIIATALECTSVPV